MAAQKKEEFPGNMENMRPGNSSPRSALFLKTSMEKARFSRKSTEGPNI